MEKFISYVQEKIGPFVEKISNYKFLSAVARGFQLLLPITLMGAFSALFAGIDVGGWQTFITGSGVKSLLQLLTKLTTDLMAVYAVLSISYNYTKILKHDNNALTVSILALVTFILITPLVTVENTQYISFNWLGAKGIICAMLISWFVPVVYCLFIDKKWGIRLPEDVPPMVQSAFNGILPSALILLLGLAVNMIFSGTSFECLNGLIYSILQKPLSALQSNFFAFMLIMWGMQFLWFFGIHGGNIFGGIMMTLYMGPTMENVAAFAAGEPLPHVFTLGFMTLAATPLVYSALAILLVKSKKARLKELGKISVVPAFFGISEPLRYGLPMVLNFKLLIPQMILQPILCTIAYLSIVIGFIPGARTGMLGNVPIFVSGWLAAGWQGIVIQVIEFVVCFVVWVPFVKMLETED